MSCPILVTLNGMGFDCETADGDGIIWTADVDGWWAPTAIDAHRHPIAVGEVISAAHEKAKALVLRGGAARPAPHPELGALFQTATRTLNRAIRLAHIPGLLTVAEDALSLQAYVRRVGDPRYRMNGVRHTLEFEVPLLAEDPYKYSSSLVTNTDLQLVTTGLTDSATVVNNGDAPTLPVITIDGPATNPKVINADDDNKYVRYVGVLGGADVLVIDHAAATMELNGTVVAYDVNSRFFALLPGNNALTYERTGGSGTTTAQVDYRHAYT